MRIKIIGPNHSIGQKNAFNIRKALHNNLTTRISELVQAALGQISPTLLIRNAKVLNVYTGEIIPASICIYRDTIVYVGPENGETRYDKAKDIIEANGSIAIPGLVDTHLHIESTMAVPSRFAEAVLPHGTTTVCADPHEIANVLGKEGVRMMVENAKDLPMKIHFFAPTCIPESSAVTAGAEVSPKDVEEMLGWDGICGLGEVMDYEGVLASSPKMIEILEIGKRWNAVIDGHAVLLTGRRLNAYVASGPEADHENFLSGQILEKIRTGMYLKLRGPDILDTKAFVEALSKIPKPWNVILVTDDVMPDRLIDSGHLEKNVRAFIAAGLEPIEAVRSATLRPALHMHMYNLGAIAPGKTADILLLDGALENFKTNTVISNGIKVAEKGKILVQIPQRPFSAAARNSVKVRELTEEDFRIENELPIKNGRIIVNAIDFAEFVDQSHNKTAPGFLEMVLTKLQKVELEVKDGEIASKEAALVCIFERHGKNGSRSIGVVRNLLGRGAFATTIAHDAHNLMVVGKNPKDMLLAANLVIKSSGGSAAVMNGKNLAQIQLPIAGLMSEEPVEITAGKMREMRSAFKEMGIIDHPYMPIPSLLTLSVIPHARITDKGIYDVDAQKFVELVA